ncbi:MAG TPA: protein kinase [Vicinamibacteria bacterium]|jgi:HAMP domain-containing protein|nr:protein kinase [Vicinamibacteria bacterium]
MGLTQKILLFTGVLVVALVVTSLAFTTFQAERLANESITRALQETHQVWETFQADRYNKLKLGLRVLGNDSPFKAACETNDPATVYDMLQERGKDLGADFFVATDPGGRVIARSDRPGAEGENLASDPIVQKPLEGVESATVWRQGDKLYHAVSVPMAFAGKLVGVLVAGYAINEALANQLRILTHSEVAFVVEPPDGPPQLSVSSLGPEEAALRAVLGRPELRTEGKEPFQVELAGERHVGIRVPLKSASGATVGSMVALRSMAEETASFRQFRSSLVLVSLVVTALGLGLAYLAASSISGPVRRLVDLVEQARNGSYSGVVSVDTHDEIGVLARAFSALLSELKEKEQMIGFLREGMTLLKRGGNLPLDPGATESGTGATVALSSVAAAAALTIGRGFAGRYEILGAVGQGGMGVVYRARDRQLDEVVALKVLRLDVLREDATLLDRFKLEIKLARKITHRNVLRTHDFGEADGISYISMEYLEGVTLKDLIRSKGPLPLQIGLSIAKQMCHGLEAAHLQGVVHRDIKPQNVLILPETGELKIMDFGVARISEVKSDASGLTAAGAVVGTPDYMPPEQVQGQPADFRSDIYSLGVVLFEVFTGALPFTGDTVVGIMLGHIQTAPPPPRTLNPRLAPALEALILRCMEKSPARRYAKVGDILADLASISSSVEAA